VGGLSATLPETRAHPVVVANAGPWLRGCCRAPRTTGPA